MVSNQIIEVLNEICNKFGLAIDWTSRNVQPYLQELMAKCVAYKFATSIMWLIFGILVCTIGGVFAKMEVGSWKKYNEKGPLSDCDIYCTIQGTGKRHPSHCWNCYGCMQHYHNDRL